MHLGHTTDFKDQITSVKAAMPTVGGLAHGTTVMTLEGETRVQDLVPGQRVITRDTGMAILRRVRQRTVNVAGIQIKAGSLGHTRPEEDMVVGPDTLVHIRDWRAKALFGADIATVKAKRLIDGEFVAEQDAASMTVYELIFDKQHIVYADGLEVASTVA